MLSVFNSSEEISFMRLLESPPAGADKDSLVHEGGNRTEIAIFKNRRYLRKKSFFERFFAHKTGRDTKNIYVSVSTVSLTQSEQTSSFRENSPNIS